jgi:hypothetical protein
MGRETCQTLLIVEKVCVTLASSFIMKNHERAGEKAAFAGLKVIILMTKEQQWSSWAG